MQKITGIIILSYLIGSSFFVDTFSQNKNDSVVRFSFDTKAQLLHQGNESISVYNDNVSNIWGNRIIQSSKKVTDNPFFHSAFYGIIRNNTSLYNKYNLELNLLSEHRGMSYGLYDMDNVVFYPYYLFSFNEYVNICNKKLNILLKTGSLMNSKIHKGLRIYNIDYHGIILILNYKKYFLQFNQIGDLSYGIGLRLEELYDYSIKYNFIDKSNEKLNFGFNFSINNYAPRSIDSIIFEPVGLKKNRNSCFYYSNFGVLGEYSVHEKAGIYFQFEVRNTPYISFSENSAFLVGGDLKLKYSKISLSLNSEFRYYGWMYNYAHWDDSVGYRKNRSDTLNYYSNTVGRYLYPLMNYSNNFSQWAVYTDYQYQNIAGIELRVNLRRVLYKCIDIELEAESCTLIKEYKYEGKKTFTYLFYSGQLVYNAGKVFKLGMGLSNKSMNLDKHYQTFYMLRSPAIHFFIRKELTNL